jgi:hypothetical protein
MKKFLTIAWNWIVLSSKNPDKISTTVQGTAFLAIVSAFATAFHIGGLTEALTSTAAAIVIILKGISALMAAYGAWRKVSRTFAGTNAVLKNQQLR